MGRIPPWAHVSPSRPYIGGGNDLETCEALLYQKSVEILEDAGEVHNSVEGCEEVRNVGE